MKLSKFANLVKNGGRCAVLHVAGSGIWLSTGTAIYRATELPDMEGSEQVRTVLDMTADAWKKVYLTEDWPESVSNVLGLNLAPYAQGEQDTEKLKVAAAPNGLWWNLLFRALPRDGRADLLQRGVSCAAGGGDQEKRIHLLHSAADRSGTAVSCGT